MITKNIFTVGKLMKKIILFILVICSVCGLCSCAGAMQKGDGEIHVFYYTYSDTYISSVRSALDKSLESAGLKYRDHDGAGNQTTQTEQIQTAITSGAKCLLVNIVNTGSDDAAMGIVNLAKGADIPVIFFNREVSDEVIRSYDKCAFVGTRAEEAGILQGEMIGEYLIQNYMKADRNGDGKISYVLFKGEEGNNEAIYRTKYAVEEANKILSKFDKPALEFYDASNRDKYLVDKNGHWSAQSANEYMTTILSSYNDKNKNAVELVICNNDGMAEGAISALNASGYNTGDDNFIPVFGVDATDAARELIGGGKMAGTIKQDSDGMAEALAVIASNINGGKNMLDGIDKYSIDEGINKIRIAYSKYLAQ